MVISPGRLGIEILTQKPVPEKRVVGVVVNDNREAKVGSVDIINSRGPGSPNVRGDHAARVLDLGGIGFDRLLDSARRAIARFRRLARFIGDAALLVPLRLRSRGIVAVLGVSL